MALHFYQAGGWWAKQMTGIDDIAKEAKMRAEKFDERLRILSAIVGSFDSDELFIIEYGDLLKDVKADEDPQRRQQHAQRMKKLLMIQAEFLLNAWLAAKRDEGNIQ
jgi:hypothetical protein